MTIDLDMLRHEVRAIDYVRGDPVQAAIWREDDALFDMLRDERVPLLLAAQIILKL